MSGHPVSAPSTPAPVGALPAAHVQVVRGTPDDVELAALVAGIVAAVGQDGLDAASAGADLEPGRPAWSDPARAAGRTGGVWHTGPDAWRWSLRG